MKNIFSLLMGFALIIMSCESPTGNLPPDYPEGQIVGRVTDATNDLPITNVKVFLGRSLYMPGLFNELIDTTSTDEFGYYSFSGITAGTYYIYAIDSSTLSVSQILKAGIIENDSSQVKKNFYMHSYSTGGTVSATVTSENGSLFDSLTVYLLLLSNGKYSTISSKTFYSRNDFELYNVATGNYLVFISATDSTQEYTGYSEYFFHSGELTGILLDDINLSPAGLVAWKPVIYIYPEEKTTFSVQLNFSNGTKLLESVPAYCDGWNVTVDTDGRINEQYPYLFYDAYLPSTPDLDRGYCIATNSLATDLTTILSAYGLTAAEINDLVEYWQAYLTEYPYYLVYPITDQSIDKYVSLAVKPEPKSQFRIWLFFKGTPQATSIPQPTITRFVRKRTTVVEWGGAIM
ncbi:MAG: carboxypeptidase-like regulatory domain-containing protein [Candidatus Marinimicrobia bacterium]|nr:carboxypeptidase-like regulatory domain-containing protein [Candidatus Neomarinimicrobiota bacterium]